jgi:hypothetical protein
MPAVTPLPNGARISETLTRGDGPVQGARSIAERSLWIEREGAVLLPFKVFWHHSPQDRVKSR